MQSSVRMPFCSSVSVGGRLVSHTQEIRWEGYPDQCLWQYALLPVKLPGNLGPQAPSVCNWYLGLNLGNM